MKRKNTVREIFANVTSDKELISKIYNGDICNNENPKNKVKKVIFGNFNTSPNL